MERTLTALACAAALGAPGHASPPRTVVARHLRPSAPGGLRPGTRVRSPIHGERVFADRRHGFALAQLRGGGTYPVATADGGRTWRTDGPVLHVPAAQGPVAVDQPGVAGPRLYFAWCNVCNTVVDVTPDAGRHWWQAFLPGTVLDVSGGHGLTAVVQGERGALWIYRLRGGRRWTREGTLK